METRHTLVERVSVQEGAAPPGRILDVSRRGWGDSRIAM